LNKKLINEVKDFIFSGLFNTCTVNRRTLLKSLQPPLLGGGEVVFDDGAVDPSPRALKGVRGQGQSRLVLILHG